MTAGPAVSAQMNKNSWTHWQLCPKPTGGKLFFDDYKNLNIYKDTLVRDYAIHLIRQLHLTQGARYEAARRLKKKNRVSITSILVLTFYSMFFSMISTFDKIPTPASKDLLALLSVFMSSFIAAFSVYEAAKRYDVRSEAFLRSARLIQSLRDRLVGDFLSKKLTWELHQEYEREYFAILDSHSDNHGNIDYLMFRMNIGKLNRCQRWRTKLMHLIAIWWLFLFSVTSPVMVFYLYQVVLYFTESSLPPQGSPTPKSIMGETIDAIHSRIILTHFNAGLRERDDGWRNCLRFDKFRQELTFERDDEVHVWDSGTC